MEKKNPWISAISQLYQTIGEVVVMTLGGSFLGSKISEKYGNAPYWAAALGIAGFSLAIYRVYRWSRKQRQVP
jgi:hypothetical protein